MEPLAAWNTICPGDMAKEGSRVEEGLAGVEVIMDDFLVIGFCDTVAEAVENHDKNLVGFFERAR